MNCIFYISNMIQSMSQPQIYITGTYIDNNPEVTVVEIHQVWSISFFSVDVGDMLLVCLFLCGVSLYTHNVARVISDHWQPSMIGT